MWTIDHTSGWAFAALCVGCLVLGWFARGLSERNAQYRHELDLWRRLDSAKEDHGRLKVLIKMMLQMHEDDARVAPRKRAANDNMDDNENKK